MSRYRTPGLYFETVDNARDDVNPARVDIPAFIGIASQGPVHQPTQINSQAQFQAIFGSFIPNSYLAYVVKAFFENGGTRCYVVRVSAATARTASIDLYDEQKQKTLCVTASSPGSWGNNLTLLLAHSSNFATQTLPPPPPPGIDRRNIFVASITGFSPGTLVRFFQAGSPTAYHIVVANFAQQKVLLLDSPLEASYKLNDPISLETVEFALTVYVAGNISEIFPSLSLVDYVEDQNKNRIDNPRYIERVINAGGSLLISVQDKHSTTPLPGSFPALIGAGGIALVGGYDGLADLTLTDLIGDPASDQKRGLRTLEDVRAVATIAMPDLTLQPTLLAQPQPPSLPDPCLPNSRPLPVGKPRKPQVSEVFKGFSSEDVFQAQQAMIDFCEQQGRCIALLDPPVKQLQGSVFNVAEKRIVQQNTAVRQVQSDIFDITDIQNWRQRFDSKYAALYYPQLLVYDPLKLGGRIVRAIPPCGHVAGMFARVDAETGPHRAPANEELSWVQGANVDITAAVQGVLNPQGINCIRTFAGRGIRIYGARTLSSAPSWIYVNVRRLMIMLERSLEVSTQWVAFEPNNFTLRQTLVLTISTFLETLWENGALIGAKSTDAFFVKCDDQNNPPALADLGQLLVEVGVAPVIPAEFVILRIGITQGELEVTE